MRFGDPECQVLMLRLMSDLVPALIASRDGILKNFDLRWFDEAALTVVMAANGYPGSYGKGSVIEGLDEAAAARRTSRFSMPARRPRAAASWRTAGACSTSARRRHASAHAQARAYAAVDKIRWPDGFCRRDIGFWRSPTNNWPVSEIIETAIKFSIYQQSIDIYDCFPWAS